MILAHQPLSRPSPGEGFLGVELVAGRGAVTSVRATSPLKILVGRSRGPAVWAWLSSFGGGLVAGDETKVALKLGPRARCFLGTQASTKVYRNPAGKPCGHSLRAELEAGSILVLAPDPVQAFAGSRYRQRQEFNLAKGAGLVVVDWISGGRAARGERWAFNGLESRNEVYSDGNRILVDSLVMDPADGPLNGRFRMGRFNSLALVLVMGEPFEREAGDILGAMAGLAVTQGAPLAMSASPVRGGVLARIAGERTEDVAAEIRDRLAFLGEFIHDDPWSRKW